MREPGTIDILSDLSEMIEDLKYDGSIYWKQEVLSRYDIHKELMGMIYNPFNVFNITSNNVLKYRDQLFNGIKTPPPEYIPIFSLGELLYKLSNRIITGDVALQTCYHFISEYPEYEETILKILDKDLKCGINVKTINKVWCKLIPEFNVPLAKVYKDGMCDFDKETWYASRKLDGVRCLAFINEDGSIKFYSRKGKEFFTLGNIERELINKWEGTKGIILDGEICIEENGLENFQSVMSEIRRKDHTIDNPKFYIFDCYTIDCFLHTSNSTHKYSYMMNELEFCIKDSKCIEVLKHDIITDKKDFENILKNVPNDWEGVMLRKDTPSQFKRSNNLLKVKRFKDEEYRVLDIRKSTKIIDGIETDCVGSLVIEHKGYIVNVGSGLSDNQRIDWRVSPEKIVGKTITVQYFSESVDKEGLISLRFPTLKHVWNEEKI